MCFFIDRQSCLQKILIYLRPFLIGNVHVNAPKHVHRFRHSVETERGVLLYVKIEVDVQHVYGLHGSPLRVGRIAFSDVAVRYIKKRVPVNGDELNLPGRVIKTRDDDYVGV